MNNMQCARPIAWASLTAVLLNVVGCVCYSPLLSESQIAAIQQRDEALKLLARQHQNQLHSGTKVGTLVVFNPNSPSSTPLMLEGDSALSALDNWLDENLVPKQASAENINDYLAAFAYRSPTAVEPQINTFAELRAQLAYRRSLDDSIETLRQSLAEVQALANELPEVQALANELQAAVLDSVKLGVVVAQVIPPAINRCIL